MQYDISLHCITDGLTSNTVDTSSLSNGFNDIVICSDNVNNDTGLNATFACAGTYTVAFTFMRLVVIIVLNYECRNMLISVKVCHAFFKKLASQIHFYLYVM